MKRIIMLIAVVMFVSSIASLSFAEGKYAAPQEHKTKHEEKEQKKKHEHEEKELKKKHEHEVKEQKKEHEEKK